MRFLIVPGISFRISRHIINRGRSWQRAASAPSLSTNVLSVQLGWRERIEKAVWRLDDAPRDMMVEFF